MESQLANNQTTAQLKMSAQNMKHISTLVFLKNTNPFNMMTDALDTTGKKRGSKKESNRSYLNSRKKVCA